MFVETTTAARGLEAAAPRAATRRRLGEEIERAADQPRVHERAGAPHGWHVTDASLDPYAVAVEDGRSPNGGRAVRIAGAIAAAVGRRAR